MLQKLEFSRNDFERNLTLPTEFSEELAEFIGILTGDGYIGHYPKQYKYILEIAGHSVLDNDYLIVYVSNLVKDLFNLESSFFFRKDQNSMYLRLISKGLFNYLSFIGFKSGKKGNIGIVNWITSNRNYMLSFLRGFIDTDGCIRFRKGTYPIISMSSKSEKLIKLIFDFLKKEGFSLKNYYKEIRKDKRGYSDSIIYRIYLNGHSNFRLWMDLIGFGNNKHLIKIERHGNAGI